MDAHESDERVSCHACGQLIGHRYDCPKRTIEADKQQAATPSETSVLRNYIDSCDGVPDKLAIRIIRSLEGALTERTEELAEAARVDDVTMTAFGKLEDKFREQVLRAETAEAEVARLKDLVGRCRPEIEFALKQAPHRRSRFLLSLLTEIDKEIKP